MNWISSTVWLRMWSWWPGCPAQGCTGPFTFGHPSLSEMGERCWPIAHSTPEAPASSYTHMIKGAQRETWLLQVQQSLEGNAQKYSVVLVWKASLNQRHSHSIKEIIRLILSYEVIFNMKHKSIIWTGCFSTPTQIESQTSSIVFFHSYRIKAAITSHLLVF